MGLCRWGKPGVDVMEAYAKATAGGAAGGDTVPSTAGPGLAAFCGLTPHWTLFSPDRVGRWAFGGQASSDTVTCETSRGMLKISPRQYTKAALAAQPHAVEMLSGAPQQPPDATPATSLVCMSPHVGGCATHQASDARG